MRPTQEKECRKQYELQTETNPQPPRRSDVPVRPQRPASHLCPEPATNSGPEATRRFHAISKPTSSRGSGSYRRHGRATNRKLFDILKNINTDKSIKRSSLLGLRSELRKRQDSPENFIKPLDLVNLGNNISNRTHHTGRRKDVLPLTINTTNRMESILCKGEVSEIDRLASPDLCNTSHGNIYPLDDYEVHSGRGIQTSHLTKLKHTGIHLPLNQPLKEGTAAKSKDAISKSSKYDGLNTDFENLNPAIMLALPDTDEICFVRQTISASDNVNDDQSFLTTGINVPPVMTQEEYRNLLPPPLQMKKGPQVSAVASSVAKPGVVSPETTRVNIIKALDRENGDAPPMNSTPETRSIIGDFKSSDLDLYRLTGSSDQSASCRSMFQSNIDDGQTQTDWVPEVQSKLSFIPVLIQLPTESQANTRSVFASLIIPREQYFALMARTSSADREPSCLVRQLPYHLNLDFSRLAMLDVVRQQTNESSSINDCATHRDSFEYVLQCSRNSCQK